MLFFREEQARERRQRRALLSDTNAAFVGGDAAKQHAHHLESDT